MRGIGQALFLDLDGTLIVTKSGLTFPKDTHDWKLKDGILRAVSKYVEQGHYVMIVSNQGGIEAGHVKMNDFRQKIRAIYNEVIVQTGIPFARIGYRYSISNNPEDYYRKPNPGMGYDLAMSYILNLSESLMVGDASGKLRRTETVYRDSSSPSGWSYKDGQFLADVDIDRIEPAPIGPFMGTVKFYDFADSDLKFARACGMMYLDVEDFIQKYSNG